MATLPQVQMLIQQGFRGADTTGLQVSGGRIIGEFHWSAFKGMPAERRLRMFAEKVRDPLGIEALNLGVVVPLAPGEKAF